MKLSKEEFIARKIALLLLQLEPNNYEPDRTYDIVAHDGVQMAYRAMRSQTDPTWWEICGKPHWNERMMDLKEQLADNNTAAVLVATKRTERRW